MQKMKAGKVFTMCHKEDVVRLIDTLNKVNVIKHIEIIENILVEAAGVESASISNISNNFNILNLRRTTTEQHLSNQYCA
ncbi:MAG: hypothetical protein JRE65_03610 [Deltaproteobacteria bacterium]|nr:hypothetical protein [Deltaproteobacteria bacterium]